MTTSTSSIQPITAPNPRASLTGWLPRMSPPTLALTAIMLLAAALNFVNIDAIGQANTYYTAAVEAMLQSPANFFFVAAEPGGSVTIDKPPLGLWLQAISALFLGVNGFAVTLPQIVAGILCVPLVYLLVKRWFGAGAGLIAALVMAIMPVSIAVQRNNTMDATLIFTLLLAAWAFVKATETGRLRWLLLGGVLVGLGFNIKMLQAFLPLPAFYALYFFGANIAWRRKFAHLALTTVALLAVSLSWIIAVDLTPADQRPYVGSSQSNSALELAIGYNGLQRLLGLGGAPRGGDGAGGQFTPPSGADATTNGQFAPPAGMQLPATTPAPSGAPRAGGGMFGGEVGTAGVLRLFTQPLDNEIGWLLPFGLLSIGLLAGAARPRLPLKREHLAVVLWGGWLLTEVVFFSVAGFFHAYYLAMLTPPLAALVGIGMMRLWTISQRRKALGIALLLAAAGGTLLVQASITAGYLADVSWLLIPTVVLAVGGLTLIAARFVPRLSRLAVPAFVALVIAMTLVPAAWAGMTTLQSGVNTTLPAAYGGTTGRLGGRGDGAPLALANAGGSAARPFGGITGGIDEELLAYLEANTQGMRWMLAVGSSMQGAGYVLESGRGVLYMGGFSGQDPVVDAERLQAYVDAGELRYVLSGGGRGGPGMGSSSAVSEWLQSSCMVVTDISVNGGTLYDCAPAA